MKKLLKFSSESRVILVLWFATLWVATNILSFWVEEEKFKAEMAKNLDKCAYYPPRPALKFIPTP